MGMFRCGVLYDLIRWISICCYMSMGILVLLLCLLLLVSQFETQNQTEY
jgi:hypothetical protein